jgi:hypothetical protein
MMISVQQVDMRTWLYGCSSVDVAGRTARTFFVGLNLLFLHDRIFAACSPVLHFSKHPSLLCCYVCTRRAVRMYTWQ